MLLKFNICAADRVVVNKASVGPAPKRRALAGAALAVAAGLSMFGASPASADSIMDRIAAGEPIRVGYSETKPFSFTLPDGTFTGSDVVVLERLFKSFGDVKIEPVRAQFGSLIPGLKAGRLDLIAAGLYIKPDRCKQVAFSEPNFVIGVAIVAKAGNPHNIHSLQDIAANPELKIGNVVGAGGFTDQLLKAGVKQDQIVLLPDVPSIFAAINAGRVDAEIESTITIGSVLQAANDPGLERVEPFSQPTDAAGKPLVGVGAYAVRLDDKEFLEKFNKELVALMKSPDYPKLMGEFGFASRDLPQNITAAQYCQE